MNRRTATAARLSMLFGFLAVFPAGFIATAVADAPSRSAATAALSKVLTAAVARNDAPGVVGLVVDRQGVVYQGSAGKLGGADGPALPVDAIFNIASMTKPVTSVAMMMLVEQGKVALDDPVSKYLPGFDHLQVLTKFNAGDGKYETRPATKVMTVRHLLTHTSGIGYGFSSPALARLQQGTTKSEWELPLLHEPGEKWTYGASTRVLGLIVEKVSGENLEAFDQKHILGPLGMTDTSYAVPAAKQARLIQVFARVDGKMQLRTGAKIPDTPTPPFTGDGGLYSTAQDYGKFMRMLLNGGHLGDVRILSEKSVRRMGENNIGGVVVSQQPVGIPELTKPFPLGAGRDKFGLGFQLTQAGPDGTKYRSPGSMSWAGLFNTEFWVDPKAGIGGVLLMQYLPFYDDGAIRTLQDFESTVYRELVKR
ncbi:MAG TPA: serine hydrolase domain-containing protein [Steroidobacteraceae bacterium]|jgi:CubicO group peptidase (beta-lactamase class C family)